jgi:hypothetical protein
MELFGFEAAPDFTLVGGSFELTSFHEWRQAAFWRDSWTSEPQTPQQALIFKPVLPATADELWRARHYGPRHEQRFHYRYIAAELAWRAAGMMTRDTEENARLLAIAGGWLKNRDPKSADRFYKALVSRNPSVPLAQAADQKRWFPVVEWDFDLELK